jgi:four helix bundle protein
MPERVVDLDVRTQKFAIEAVRLGQELRDQSHLWDMTRQFTRAATSVAANQRAMRRGRSLREFADKLLIVNEEFDEAVLWLDLIVETATSTPANFEQVRREALELRAIYAKARRTVRGRS